MGFLLSLAVLLSSFLIKFLQMANAFVICRIVCVNVYISASYSNYKDFLH